MANLNAKQTENKKNITIYVWRMNGGRENYPSTRFRFFMHAFNGKKTPIFLIYFIFFVVVHVRINLKCDK